MRSVVRNLTFSGKYLFLSLSMSCLVAATTASSLLLLASLTSSLVSLSILHAISTTNPPLPSLHDVSISLLSPIPTSFSSSLNSIFTFCSSVSTLLISFAMSLPSVSSFSSSLPSTCSSSSVILNMSSVSFSVSFSGSFSVSSFLNSSSFSVLSSSPSTSLVFSPTSSPSSGRRMSSSLMLSPRGRSVEMSAILADPSLWNTGMSRAVQSSGNHHIDRQISVTQLLV